MNTINPVDPAKLQATVNINEIMNDLFTIDGDVYRASQISNIHKHSRPYSNGRKYSFHMESAGNKQYMEYEDDENYTLYHQAVLDWHEALARHYKLIKKG